MPTLPEVTTEVKKIVGKKANLDPSLIQDEGKLTEAPLYFDAPKLAALTLAMRTYLKTIDPSLGIDAGEVSASGLTVSRLITRIFNIIQGP